MVQKGKNSPGPAARRVRNTAVRASNKNTHFQSNPFNDPLFNELSQVLDKLTKKYNISEKELLSLCREKALHIPLSASMFEKLSTSEIIVKYLKEEKHMTYHDISDLLKRNDRTIWGAYSRARKKHPEKFVISKSELSVPVKIFQDRQTSFLESLVEYCHDSLNLKLSHIARLTKRDFRTIWTVHDRARKKRGKK